MKSAAPRDLKLAIVLTSCEPSRDSGSPVQFPFFLLELG